MKCLVGDGSFPLFVLVSAKSLRSRSSRRTPDGTVFPPTRQYNRIRLHVRPISTSALIFEIFNTFLKPSRSPGPKMSKLSPGLKQLIAAPFARPDTTPAPRGILGVYKNIRDEANKKDVGRNAWLAMSVSSIRLPRTIFSYSAGDY